MIVYGDPSTQCRLRDLVDNLSSFYSGSSCTLDWHRQALVRAGQIEQAVFDSDLSEDVKTACAQLTDAVAAGMSLDFEPLRLDVEVTVKLPEGFAFYGLYPESYADAARQWSEGKAGSVLVVGLRSIGTTLSAVVARQLRSQGFSVRRITVRPDGHPYDRQVSFDPSQLAVDWLIVVDEGPGRSGSSMASVARFALEQGFLIDRIVFFPSEDRAPGPEASQEFIDIWKSVPRYCGSSPDVLKELKAETEKLFDSPVVETHDLGAGAWRTYLGISAPARPSFERSKFLMRTKDGQGVLWKFVGFTWPPARDPWTIQLSRSRWSVLPLELTLGYMAMPWVEGRRLTQSDWSAKLVEYVRDVRGLDLTMAEAKEAYGRLRHMLYWNTAETEGEDEAQRLCESLEITPRPHASFGDGRLAPHEWVQRPDGSLIKVDCFGHDCDHTIIGHQPWLWDAAGLIEEWSLNRNPFPEIDARELAFYRAAYRSYKRAMDD